MLSSWRGFFDYLGRSREVSGNPCAGVKAPRAATNLPQFLSPDAATALVCVEDDSDLSYNRQIVFQVDDNGRSAAEQSAAHWKWAEELFRHCPATHVHVFSLG